MLNHRTPAGKMVAGSVALILITACVAPQQIHSATIESAQTGGLADILPMSGTVAQRALSMAPNSHRQFINYKHMNSRARSMDELGDNLIEPSSKRGSIASIQEKDQVMNGKRVHVIAKRWRSRSSKARSSMRALRRMLMQQQMQQKARSLGSIARAKRSVEMPFQEQQQQQQQQQCICNQPTPAQIPVVDIVPVVETKPEVVQVIKTPEQPNTKLEHHLKPIKNSVKIAGPIIDGPVPTKGPDGPMQPPKISNIMNEILKGVDPKTASVALAQANGRNGSPDSQATQPSNLSSQLGVSNAEVSPDSMLAKATEQILAPKSDAGARAGQESDPARAASPAEGSSSDPQTERSSTGSDLGEPSSAKARSDEQAAVSKDVARSAPVETSQAVPAQRASETESRFTGLNSNKVESPVNNVEHKAHASPEKSPETSSRSEPEEENSQRLGSGASGPSSGKTRSDEQAAVSKDVARSVEPSSNKGESTGKSRSSPEDSSESNSQSEPAEENSERSGSSAGGPLSAGVRSDEQPAASESNGFSSTPDGAQDEARSASEEKPQATAEQSTGGKELAKEEEAADESRSADPSTDKGESPADESNENAEDKARASPENSPETSSRSEPAEDNSERSDSSVTLPSSGDARSDEQPAAAESSPAADGAQDEARSASDNKSGTAPEAADEARSADQGLGKGESSDGGSNKGVEDEARASPEKSPETSSRSEPSEENSERSGVEEPDLSAIAAAQRLREKGKLEPAPEVIEVIDVKPQHNHKQQKGLKLEPQLKMKPKLELEPEVELKPVHNHSQKVHRPKVHEPKVHEPKVHEPKVHEPKVHEHKVHEPKVHEHKVHEPKVHEEKVHEPKPMKKRPAKEKVHEHEHKHKHITIEIKSKPSARPTSPAPYYEPSSVAPPVYTAPSAYASSKSYQVSPAPVQAAQAPPSIAPGYGPAGGQSAAYGPAQAEQVSPACRYQVDEMHKMSDELVRLVESLGNKLADRNYNNGIAMSPERREQLRRRLGELRIFAESTRMAASLVQLGPLTRSARAAGLEVMRMSSIQGVQQVEPYLRQFAVKMRHSYSAYRKVCY